jgi:hypothetical protein
MLLRVIRVYSFAIPNVAVPSHQFVSVNPWTLGLLVGGAQLIYFGTNAWIASYNQAVHAPALTWLALNVLNAAQLPASLLVTLLANKLIGRQLPSIAFLPIALASGIVLILGVLLPIRPSAAAQNLSA